MSNSSSSGNTGFLLGLLGIAFVVLKLCGVISWSWWWVTAPFWGGLAIVLAMLIIAGLVLLAGRVVKENSQKNERTKYPIKSKWEERMDQVRERQKKVREQNAKAN